MSEMTNITTEASDSPVSNKTVLRLDDVRKSFGNTQVLRGISFDIHQHEVVALLGPSGSGKSTLMKCVNLLEQVDDGQIWLGNTDITDPRADQDKIRARIGVVFQQFNLFPHMSVLRPLDATNVFEKELLRLFASDLLLTASCCVSYVSTCLLYTSSAEVVLASPSLLIPEGRNQDALSTSCRFEIHI